jgi:hypothetical protein
MQLQPLSHYILPHFSLFTRTPGSRPETVPVFAPWTHKQRDTINHYNIHYFAGVYCGQNLKHLFRNWISEPFSYTNGERLLILALLIQLNGGYESYTAGGPVSCGNTGGPLFRFSKGGHTLEFFCSFISLYGCLSLEMQHRNGNSAVFRYVVQPRVAKPGHVLQAHSFTKVDRTHRRHLNGPHLTKS